MIRHTGPTGRIIRGHVLDVNEKAFVGTLQFYDPQLYVKWNPTKLRGWGCWEVRRRPDMKLPVDVVPIGEDASIVRLEYKEFDIVNHVLDAAFLNYDIMRKLREMDTWNKGHDIHDMDYINEQRAAELKQQQKEDLKYLFKENKNMFRYLKDLVKSGHNPARIVTGNQKWAYKSRR